MIKKCVVCGAEFEPRYNMIYRQKCCSKPCTVTHNRRCEKEKRQSKGWKTEARKKYYAKTADKIVCKLCGKPTVAGFSGRRQHFHEHCVVNDAINTVLGSQKLSKAQLSRLYAMGYDAKEIKEMIKDGECYA